MAQASDEFTAWHMLMSNLTKFPQFPSIEKASTIPQSHLFFHLPVINVSGHAHTIYLFVTHNNFLMPFLLFIFLQPPSLISNNVKP